MKCGVVYKFKKAKKINGTLFYCFEYYTFLRQFIDIKFYIVGISDSDIALIKRLFSEKYTVSTDGIIAVSPSELYFEKLDRTLIFDVMTFYDIKEFLTGDIHCYSNDSHPMFRYKNERKVTYYGSYDWQPRDVFSYLKFNFEIFKKYDQTGYGIFLSANDVAYLKSHYHEYQKRFDRPVYLKKGDDGKGNILEYVDSVHYVHTGQDKNNRIIPEAFFYGKEITLEDLKPEISDSILLRYNDIKENGLEKYTLSKDDEMVKAILQ